MSLVSVSILVRLENTTTFMVFIATFQPPLRPERRRREKKVRNGWLVWVFFFGSVVPYIVILTIIHSFLRIHHEN